MTSDSESEIKRMMIIFHDSSFNLIQSQMLLQFEEYIKQQLHFLHLDIQINRNDISDMKENVSDIIVSYKKIHKFVAAQET
jgi:hypothetical protein